MRPCFPSNLKISTWNQKLFHRKRVRERISESCHVRKDKQAIFRGSDPAWMMPAYHQILFDGNLVTLVMRGFNSTDIFDRKQHFIYSARRTQYIVPFFYSFCYFFPFFSLVLNILVLLSFLNTRNMNNKNRKKKTLE